MAFFNSHTNNLVEGKRVGIAVAMAAAAVGSWWWKALRPPRPLVCGSDGGPPVTAPRIRLRDGRFLAYAESGVARERAASRSSSPTASPVPDWIPFTPPRN
uniref:Uncharacterized protein n=1 Tax=Ananas comosus var. bracteatus TaxID=296719 RepID=A0A6V7PX81_ANACO|nr:unnamed protein product [Ananas comosus var. bracteatus]